MMQPLPEPGFAELLRQAMEGMMPSQALYALFDRMERQA